MMEGPNAASYREWDEQTDCAWFFYGSRPTSAVRKDVRPLTAAYASQLWGWVFPTDKDVLPLIAKDKKSWLKKILESEPIRFDNPQKPSLREHYRRLFPWRDDDLVFFLVRREIGYQCLWRVFVEQADHFPGLYDEGLLFHPTAREVAVFWEVSAMFVGRRGKRHLSLAASQGCG